MKNKLFFFCLLTIPLSAEVSFDRLDLSNDSRLLFQARYSGVGNSSQDGLFLSRLTDLTMRQLTAFPEKMVLLEEGNVIQVQNAFGCARMQVAGGLPSLVNGFDSFVGNISVSKGRVEPIAASENGKWILRVEPVSAAYGNLMLMSVDSGKKTLIATHVECPDRYFPALWSPDSQVFIYERGGNLYYYPIGDTIPRDERYRLIGEGSIVTAAWGKFGDFFYIKGSTVYRVRGSEVFFRSIYRDFLEIGVSVGTLPFSFDKNFDQFYVSPSSNALLLFKGGKTLFLYPLGANDVNSLPFLRLPESCFKITVLWAPDSITIVAGIRKQRKKVPMAFRLNGAYSAPYGAFTPMTIPAFLNAALSPDGKKILFWGEKGVVLFDNVNLKVLQDVSESQTYSCIWLGNEEFVVGDAKKIERVSIDKNELKRDLICLASVDAFAFESQAVSAAAGQESALGGPTRILAKSGQEWFVTDGQGAWSKIDAPIIREASVVSGRYRVYLENQGKGDFVNLPMIRNMASVGTLPLLRVNGTGGESLSRQGVNQKTMMNGSGASSVPLNKPSVAVCFDLYNDDAGLNDTLTALDAFGVKATFFLNGEFMRQHPQAVQDIADAGHETASMFFAVINLSTARYQIDANFISRGLARNEDEFFQITGRELQLLWHPPFYAASSDIIEAASEAGYRTVIRDIDPMDSFSNDDAARMGILQSTASSMVDRIMETKRAGSIIPIRLGLLSGGRNDYLFHHINVLFDALIKEGYSIGTVSEVIKQTQ
ncbi:MAG: polysaccharide deacetylase family protein [Treponema sp.]|jgi:peptidoglycan/xylan/chitin deacetylase (PgdA/CDA1 family)|nr:polysaccharide deacetylase family protein [Treponema sp.]